MKIKSFILAMVACAGLFTACSEEIDGVDNVDGNGNEVKADAYLSVSFTMPSSASTRANPNGGEAGDGNEAGSDAENAVTDVDMYLFNVNADGSIAGLGLIRHIERGEITGTQEGSTYTTNPVQVNTGKYAVYIVVNQPKAGNDNINSIAIGASLEEFQAKVYSAAAGTGEYCTDKSFLMTNAYTIGAEKGSPNAYQEGIVDITEANNTTTNAAKVTVSVERAAARIDFSAINTNNAYAVKNVNNEQIATVTIKSFKILNTRNSAWFLKRVSSGSDVNSLVVGGDETPDQGINTNYVVENKFTIKNNFSKTDTDNTKFSGTDYTDNYSRRFNSYVSWKKITATTTSNDTKNQVLAYCMENTMNLDHQIKGLTTTILFRAQYVPTAKAVIGTYDPQATNKTFYRFKGGSTLYATPVDILKAKYNKTDDAKAYEAAIEGNILGFKAEDYANLTAEEKAAYITKTLKDADIEDYYAADIEQFVDGYCYYTFMIRHSNNGDDNVSGIMEFATVRNNIYKLQINSISSLGNCNSGTPGPEDSSKPDFGRPDETDGEDNSNPEMPGVTDTDGPQEPAGPVVPFDPNTPDENVKTWMKAEIKILDWTLRNNGIDL